jgi:hypothetical protein
VKGIGDCPLIFDSTDLASPKGNPINHEVRTGYFSNNETIIIGTTAVSDLTSGETTHLSFTWNTTDFPVGNYSLSAYASPVPGETNITDNLYVDGMVEIVPPFHDIAIISIVQTKTIVGKGYCATINVTVENQGAFLEFFNITLYANTTVVENRTVYNLPNGTSIVLTFTWNTTTFTYGNYTIQAYAWPAPREQDTADNTCIGGIVMVTIKGDVDGDFDVDIYDVVKIAGIYGSTRSALEFNPNSDLDDDGEITIYDVVLCARHYGDTYP